MKSVIQGDLDRALRTRQKHGGPSARFGRRLPEDRGEPGHGPLRRLLSRPDRQVKKAPGKAGPVHASGFAANLGILPLTGVLICSPAESRIQTIQSRSQAKSARNGRKLLTCPDSRRGSCRFGILAASGCGRLRDDPRGIKSVGAFGRANDCGRLAADRCDNRASVARAAQRICRFLSARAALHARARTQMARKAHGAVIGFLQGRVPHIVRICPHAR